MHDLTDWHYHTLIELGSIFAGWHEYTDPRHLANRLEGIARDLRQLYNTVDGFNPRDEPSRFPVVNQDDPNKPGVGDFF